ncbi:MAG: efflux RND transporter permease subunit, partial [Candidatus Latescibacterota bacterium]
ASPEEIEQLITITLEEEIQDVDKIDLVSSKSSEGASFLWVKFEQMSDDGFDKAFRDLSAEVDKVRDLPEDAEDPDVVRFNTGSLMPIINVVLSGDQPEARMKEWAKQLREDMLDIDGVAKVTTSGVREREIWIEVDPDQLNGYGLQIQQVMEAFRVSNLNLPGGDIKMGRSEYLVRTVAEFDEVDQLKNVIVHTFRPGGQVRVRDLAEVKDTYEDARTLSRLDGRPSITLSVMKKKDGNAIRLTDEIKELTQKWQAEKLPGDVKLTLTWDSSVYIRDILKKLETNALLGMILVFAALYLFLGGRNAVFAALGIPVTFMATFFFMKATGRSLNGNSLFGLVLVLGIIVDDAIVVVENVYRYMQKGLSPKDAVIKGTPEVAVPVLTSTLTTVAAFLPLMLMPGIVGKFMKIIPIVVCLVLLASVIEAFFILPSHIADWGKVRRKEGKGNQLYLWLRGWYTRNLLRVLRKRYWVIAGVLVLAIAGAGLIPLVGVDMFAEEEFSQFSVQVRMPFGTRLAETDRILSRIEQLALALPKKEVASVVTHVGILQLEDDTLVNTHVGEVMVDLVESKYRERTSDQIIADLREKVQPISGISKLAFNKVAHGPPTGKAVEVKVKGKYLDKLQEVAELVKAELGQMVGVTDINDDFEPGKQEIRIHVDEEKAALLGLDVFGIAATVRTAFEGSKATVFRDADEEIDVVVKFRGDQREKLSDIERMRIASRSGALIPFGSVAKVSIELGVSDIQRFEGDRAITVSADLDDDVTSVAQVNRELAERFTNIEERYPGYRLDFRGEMLEFKEAFSSLERLFVVGMLLMYLILGTQFKSWVQPLIIMFTLPFAFIGAMVGLLIGRDPFSITTLFGIVALAGVVVNDSIVLIDFINKARARGVTKWKAIIDGGRLRLRPILLTSVTTILGLLPMAIGLGGKSETWGPLANTIAWGLGAATFLTLFVIPCLYAIMDDVAIKLHVGRFKRCHEEETTKRVAGELEFA